jgi:glycosyltransferase involved in cell wall biosynthesis
MRCIHVLKATGIAGAETHLLALLPALRMRGAESSVVLLEDPRRPQDELRGRFEQAGVPVQTVSIRRHVDPALTVRLRALLAREPFDVLHAHLPHGEVYGELALRSLKKVRFVVSRHNDDRFRRWLPLRPVFAPSIRRADRIIAISQAVRRFLVEVEGAPAEKTVCIPYGIDARAGAASGRPGIFRREIGAGREPIVGFVGRLVSQKGADILLKAFALVERRHPTARLVLAGDGPLRAVLERQARALGLRRALFLGWRADAADILAGIDLLAMPSRWEGFGLVALEAMAAAKPVVAARVSALPEIVLPEQTGLLVKPDDPDDLARAILRLLHEPEHAVAMGRTGRKRVRDEFTVERMARRTAEIYSRVMDIP